MTCKIDGCEKEIRYRERQICQMHYFRYMRTGMYSLKERTRKYRHQNPAGYQRIYEPDHPLKDTCGYVSEHRFVVYNHYGENIPDCELCGKPTFWDTCHIDHIDKDTSNNVFDNLRPVCRPCNTMRSRNDTPQHERKNSYPIEYDGKIDTAAGWARDERVNIAGATIRFRLRKGMSVEEALFSPRITHHNTKTKPYKLGSWSD